MLGEGGSGIVYTAQWGHREVALKVLHPTLIATQKERDRFIDEARLLADITHRSVVKVLSFGTLPDGRPYLAMEKLAGESLSQRLGRGRMNLGEAFNVFSQMVSAVDALHRRGLVHRDLKPENVMLVEGGRFAILLDFGIAKPLDSPASTVTQAGGIRGTPAYMAPERFFGSPASPASDIYELAVVMYAMLVGRLPWDVYTDPDARLNPTSPRSFGVKLPGTLEGALQGALSTRPDKRPPDVQQLLSQFQQAVEGHGGAVRQTADLAPGAAPAPTGEQTQPQNTVPARNQSTPEYAQTVLASPTPQVAPPGGQAVVQLTPAASPSGPYAQAAAPSGPYQQPPLPYAHTPHVPQIPPTQSGTIQARNPIWPTLMVAGSILILAGAMLIVFWPRGSKQTVGQTEANTKTADPKKAQSSNEPEATTKPDSKKSAGDDIADKLTQALLSGVSKKKKRARPTGPAPTDMRYIPGKADVIISARVRDMATGTAFSSLLRKLENNERFKQLFDMGKACGINLLETVDRITLATTDKKSEEFDMIMSGQWTRDKIEACIPKARDGMTATRADALTKLSEGASTYWLAWIDERTFLYSSRKGVDAAWMRKRLAKKDSFRDKHDFTDVLQNVDQHADVWIAGTGDAISEEPLIKDAPKPKLLLVQAYVAGDIKGKGWLVFKTVRDATVGAVKVKAELDKMKKEDGGMLFDSFKSRLQGNRVVVSGEINSLFASLSAGVIGAAMNKTDDDKKPKKK